MSTSFSGALSRFRTSLTDATPRRQLIWIGALVLLLAALGIAAYWALRPSYQVLFRDLKPQDAAAIITELERQKVPFRVDESTNAILVPEGDTRATRLKLMSSDLRLQGAVGFELFNNSDLGLTDFAQKVNYQRALQGELARTIMSLDEIDMARVHLTLPESSIFRRSDDRPKASVALFTRDGQPLLPETVKGIQRLVAAAVPQMAAADVTVVNQHGGSVNARELDVDDPKYALKRAIEREYERKIIQQITPMIGQRHASVSVDVVLNFDQVRVTNEAGVSQPIAMDGAAETTPPASGKSAPSSNETESVPASDGTFVERKLEQIVSAPGSIKRLSVGIVVDGELPASTLNQLRAIASAAVGATASREDSIAVFAGQGSAGPSPSIAALTPMSPRTTAAPASTKAASRATHDSRKDSVAVFSKPNAPQASSPTEASIPTASAATVIEPADDNVPPRVTQDDSHTWDDLKPFLPVAGYSVLALLVAGIAFSLLRRTRPPSPPPLSLSAEERDDYVVRLRTLLADARGHHGS